MTVQEPPVGASAFHRRETLHQEAERIAVPNFDWIAATIDGMAEACSAMAHPHLHRHHHPAPDAPV